MYSDDKTWRFDLPYAVEEGHQLIGRSVEGDANVLRLVWMRTALKKYDNLGVDTQRKAYMKFNSAIRIGWYLDCVLSDRPANSRLAVHILLCVRKTGVRTLRSTAATSAVNVSVIKKYRSIDKRPSKIFQMTGRPLRQLFSVERTTK